MLRRTVLIELILLAPACAQVPLLQPAIRHGDLLQVERLLSSGVDVNARDETGSTPLMAAAIAGNLPIAKMLLQHDSDVNARQADTQATALQYAVLGGRTELVRALLEAGARVDLVYGEQRQTILQVASTKSSTATVGSLLAAHPDIEALDRNRNSALDDAILHHRAETVALLLSHGANPRRLRADNGRSPLHEACVEGAPTIVSALIKAGADPILQDRSGQTPLDLALDYKNRSAVTVLLALASQNNELHLDFARAMESAVARGRTEIVRTLLDAGWDVNQRTSQNSAYLNDAALHGQTKTVALLLDRGARIDVRNQTGGTALHDAAVAGKLDTLDLLLRRGAFIDARDNDSGATPLMLAASLGQTAAVGFLLSHGADPALKDRSGRTAWMRAREQQDNAAMRLLESARKQPAS